MNVHIIGGGIAGVMASLAFSSLDEVKGVFLYEQSETLFSYASSKNAGILRTYERDPFVSRLSKQSALWFYLLSKEHLGLIEYSGLRIIPIEYDLLELEFQSANEWKPFFDFSNQILNLSTSWSEASMYLQSLYSSPLNRTDIFQDEIEREILGNGTVDLNIFLNCLESMILKKSNISLLFNEKLQLYQIDQQKSIHTLFFNSDKSVKIEENDLVINASGSWSKELYYSVDCIHKENILQSNFYAPPLHSYKRHLYQYNLDSSTVLDNIKKNMRFGIFWNEREDLYFKLTNKKTLIISDCEEVKTFSSDFTKNSDKLCIEISQKLINKIMLDKNLIYDSSWSCLRTFTLDDRPVIGIDLNISNLFWVSGLGGRGLSISLAIPDLILSIWKNQVTQKSLSKYLTGFTLERFF